MLGIAHVFQVAEHTICMLYNEYVYKLWLFLGAIWMSSSPHRDVAQAAMSLEVQSAGALFCFLHGQNFQSEHI